MSLISVFVVSALLIGSCDGSLRKSGWMLGGKDRTLVKIPEAKRNGPPLQKAGDIPSGIEKRQEPIVPSGPVAKMLPDMASAATTVAGKAKQQKAIIGTGKFTSNKQLPVRRAPPGRGDSITLNFVDADIRDVVKTVLGSTLGFNVAIGPNVKGKITLQTSKPIPKSAVLSTLESVLSLGGVSIVQSGSIYRVLQSSAAVRNTARHPVAGLAGSSGEAYGVEILPLEFASAAEMAKIIEPLVPSGAVVRTDSFRNLLIVGGTRHERQTISEIVTIFDVDWLSGMSFALVQLEYAQPKQAITDLERVFGTGNGEPLDGLVKFFPVERRQSILVVSSKSDFIERARGWIKRLDVGGEDEKRLYVYSVENSRATDLAAILSQVFSDAPVSLPSRSVVPGQRQAQLASSTPSASTPSSTGTTPTVTAKAFGPPINAAQATPGSAISGPRAGGGIAAAPTSSSSVVANIGGRLPEQINARIIADDINNSLVIMAKPGVWRMIEVALKKLDIVPLQVMISATIAEVTLNDDLRYGVQSFFTKGRSTATLSSIATGAVTSAFPGFSYVYNRGDIRGILDALDSITDIRVISSPQVLVLDNKTAELRVGDQVPIATQSSVSNVDPNAPTVNTVQLLDTGVVLRVTPRLNASGVINLEIDQQVNTAKVTTSSGIDSPTIAQRRLTSTVVVNSGETVALGGLINDEQNDSVSGIPLLASIPFLGKLFSSTTETSRRTELLILITPRVISNREEARAVTNDLRKSLHNAAALRPTSGN
ncbi:MAG: general secretion pathway protein D [Alphaproteobacteria bacterium]|jgi:general secretion pathway protein D